MNQGPRQEREQLQGHVPQGQGSRRTRFLRKGGEGSRRFEDEEPDRCVALTRARSSCDSELAPTSVDAGIADQEIARLRVIDKEKEKASKQQFKGESLLISMVDPHFNRLS